MYTLVHPPPRRFLFSKGQNRTHIRSLVIQVWKCAKRFSSDPSVVFRAELDLQEGCVPETDCSKLGLHTDRGLLARALPEQVRRRKRNMGPSGLHFAHQAGFYRCTASYLTALADGDPLRQEIWYVNLNRIEKTDSLHGSYLYMKRGARKSLPAGNGARWAKRKGRPLAASQ